jgi:ComF family protein
MIKQPIKKWRKPFLIGVKDFFAVGWGALNHLLWPKRCVNCRSIILEINSELCDGCWQQIGAVSGGNYCKRCGRDVSEYGISGGGCAGCEGEEFSFDAIARAGVYATSLREMILSFKTDSGKATKTLSFLANSALSGSTFLDDIDYFVPVPLHWMRRVRRGYNQSQILAEQLAHPAAIDGQRSRTRVNTDLVRIRRTKIQPSTASVHQRLKNVKGAFAVRRGHDFAGKKICLVDDVKTTGATLNECAKQLKEAGAAKVFALVLAVADQRID